MLTSCCTTFQYRYFDRPSQEHKIVSTELVVWRGDELTSQLSDGIRAEDDLIARVISTDRKANGFYATLRGKVYEIFVKIKKYCVFVGYIT